MINVSIIMSKTLSYRESPSVTNYDSKLEGLSLDDVGESTCLASCYHDFRGTSSTPLVTPIYHSSTYILDKPEDLMSCIKDGGASYSRLGNPTTEALDASINVLERGAGSLTFASGMAAVTTVLFGFLGKGDHVILQVPCYPGTLTAVNHMVNQFGIEVTKVRDAGFDDVVKATKTNTKMIWIESPCNPEIVVVDVGRMSQYAKVKDILVAVDGTFAGPYAQKVVPMGADVSIQSCTKYMGGHSDLIGGCVTTQTVKQWRVLREMQQFLGNMLSPHDASLLHRSLKTLPLRMERISDTALKVATFLEGHPKVQRVQYPGLPSHPQHGLAVKQMKVFSGMIMAEVKGGGEGGKTVAQSIKIIKMAVSLGGVESILEHPYSMTHGPYLMSERDREEAGITPGMLRISIGLEDPDDLIKDFQQALDKVVV